MILASSSFHPNIRKIPEISTLSVTFQATLGPLPNPQLLRKLPQKQEKAGAQPEKPDSGKYGC